MNSQLCACTSGKAFSQCCRPFLNKEKWAKTPQQLMRSRFSAYYLGGYGDYLIETWLPSSSIGLEAAELSLRSLDWQGMDIIEKLQNGDHALVEFKAYFLDQNGEQQVHHEISQFQRVSGRWYYAQGEILIE